MTKNKQKKLLLTTGILIAIGIIIGVSYAWWSHVVSQEGINTIESTCLEIKLTDQNPISLTNAYPITDAEARILTPYTFTITNTCTTTVEYDVNLDIMESKVNNIDNRLNSEYVAVEFNGGEKKLLNTYESVETSYPGSDYTPVEARYLTSGELSANESKTYTIKLWMDESVTVEDDAMNKNFISKIVVTAKQSHIVRLVDYVMSETSKDFEKFEHPETYQTPALTDYRYTGSNPNNYVCFGSEESVCPEDNLYRIIGVIPTQSEIGGEYENRVKLIKANSYEETESGYLKSNSSYTKNGNGYQWNATNNNAWDISILNTKVLNGVYWNHLGEYQKYISSSIWHLGAIDYTTVASIPMNNLYSLERGNLPSKSNGSLSILNNLGLMYLSDYAFSIGNAYYNQNQWKLAEEYKEKSWLYVGTYVEWLITSDPYYDSSGTSYGQGVQCAVRRQDGSGALNEWKDVVAIRPTFYLKTTVLYKSGNGSLENPYRIAINE